MRIDDDDDAQRYATMRNDDAYKTMHVCATMMLRDIIFEYMLVSIKIGNQNHMDSPASYDAVAHHITHDSNLYSSVAIKPSWAELEPRML